MLALCAWRENRGGATPGMQSVINVVMNRCAARHTTAYDEVTRRWQFSSITAKDDPQLVVWPMAGDPQWITAQQLAQQAAAGTLTDITGGATSYYALSLHPAPAWASEMVETRIIANQRFMKAKT